MEQAGKQGIMVASQSQNSIEQIQTRFKELENGFRLWLSKQSLAVEAAVVTATSGAQGAAIGAFMGTLTADAPSAFPSPPPNASLNPQAMASLKQAQALAGGPFVQARNFAVMTGVNAGISCVLKRIRGKEDVQSSMAAAFGSGAMFSLVSGMGGPNQLGNAVTSGLFFALVQGGIFQYHLLTKIVGQSLLGFLYYPGFKVWTWLLGLHVQIGQKFSQPPAEDINYAKARNMLHNLGLQSYEKNFKKGLLTDNTLPLLTDSALRDVRIPPGPRLLILEHIQRDPDLKEKRGSRK